MTHEMLRAGAKVGGVRRQWRAMVGYARLCSAMVGYE